MRSILLALSLLGLLCSCGRVDNSKRLRIITWADYVPADVAADFEKETGIHVELTLSNNEEIISKLHATGGAGFDLAQPSQDRLTGVQREFGLYKPIDLRQINLAQFRPEILEITRRTATLDGQLYALPYLWGTEGLVADTSKANDPRLRRSVPAGAERQNLHAATAADADGLCLRPGTGSVCPL